MLNTVFMTVAVAVLWVMVLTMMVKAWAEDPAERHVGGYEYMETIGGEVNGNPQI